MMEWIITSSVLLAVLILLRYVLRGKISLRLQYALWALALLRLLIPFSFGGTSFSVMNAAERVPSVWTGKSPAAGQTGVVPNAGGNDTHFDFTDDTPTDSTDNVTAPVGNSSGAVSGVVQTGPVSNGTPAEPGVTSTPVKNGPGLSRVLLAVWGTGAALVLVFFAVSNGRFAHRLRRSRRELAELQTDEGLSVYLTDAADTPCLFGLISPAIYVTPEAASDPTTLRHTLAHETTHFLHGDSIWPVLRVLCLAIHWYNPLVWWAALLSRNDAELACDEGTVKRIGEEERAEYGRTLIRMTCQKRPAILLSATTMTSGKRGIKERITLLVKKPKMAVYTLVAVVLAAAVVVGCTFTGAVKPEEGAEKPDGAEPYASLLQGDLSAVAEEDRETAELFFQTAADSEIDVEYTFVDLNGDGEEELFLRFADSPAIHRIFHEEDGVLYCVHEKDMEMNHWFTPLTDGTLLSTYDYNNAFSYAVYQMDENWDLTEVDTWFYRYGESDNPNDNFAVPSWSHGGQDLDRETFSRQFKEQVEDNYPRWNTVRIGGKEADAEPGIDFPAVPLDEYALSIAVPKFLNEEQQLTYRRAYSLYQHMFGGDTGWVEYSEVLGLKYFPQTEYEHVEYGEYTYLISQGLYKSWAEFNAAIHSVFTDRFWQERNTWDDGTRIYRDYDGRLCFIDASRGAGYYYNENFPDQFRLVYTSDTEIEFILTGHYSERHTLPGETFEERDARVRSGYEYTLEFPIRMVLTDAGWRFDEFHSALADEEERPTSTVPVGETHSDQDVFSVKVGGSRYQVSFRLEVPEEIDIINYDFAIGTHEYWDGGPKGMLSWTDELPAGARALGDGTYVRSGLGFYDGSLDAQVLPAGVTFREWYYPIADGALYLCFRWDETDLETAEAVRATLGYFVELQSVVPSAFAGWDGLLSPEDWEALSGCFPLLNGETAFNWYNTGSDWYLEGAPQVVTLAEFQAISIPEAVRDRVRLSDFTLCDMDGGGGKELILGFFSDNGAYGDYLVLHREGTEFYGVDITARGFEDLQQNGVFVSTGGAGTHSYYRLYFQNGRFNKVLQGDENWGEYFIAGASVDEAVFNAWRDELMVGNVGWFVLAA